jgi:flagellar protein FliS
MGDGVSTYGSHARVAATYKQIQVNSRSPLELVVMLYDGALAALGQARDALAQRDLVTKAQAMSKALAIVAQLQSSLDLEQGGEVAAHLDRMYTYATERLVHANLHRDPAPIDEVIRLLSPLRGAWADIAARANAVA